MAILALHNSISNIEKYDQATTLEEIKDIIDIGLYAFAECTALKDLGEYGYYEEDGTVNKSSDGQNFPKNLERICPGTFKNCGNLIINTLTFSDYKLKKIGYNAFEGCNLSRISKLFRSTPLLEYIGSRALFGVTENSSRECYFISENIKFIGDEFFSCNESNATITFNFENLKEIPWLGNNAFSNFSPQKFNIIVPRSNYYNWINWPGWKDYKNYIISYYDNLTTLPPNNEEGIIYNIKKTDYYPDINDINDTNRSENIKIYEHYGFELLEKSPVPKTKDLYLYAMIRRHKEK